MLLNIIFPAQTARIINYKGPNGITIKEGRIEIHLRLPYSMRTDTRIKRRFALVSYGHSASRCCEFRSHLIAALCQGLQISRCCRCALCKRKVKVSFGKTKKKTGRIEIRRKSRGCQRWPLINTLRQIRLANCVYTLNNPKSLGELITGGKVSLKTLLVN